MPRTQLNDLPEDETLDADALTRVRGGLLPAVRVGITDGTSSSINFALKITPGDGSVLPAVQSSFKFLK